VTDLDVLILGGGPTGLGAAWRLSQHPGAEWLLCEAEDTLGGLSRSFVDEAGYTWDIGGHVCFSHYDLFTDVLWQALGPDGFFEHERSAWVRCGSSWVPYPFQNNLHRLPYDVRERCLRGLSDAARIAATAPSTPHNLAEFIEATFGEGISEVFMRPYNEKVWATSLATMSFDWIGERVSVPDPAVAIGNANAGRDDVGWGPNNRFIFPKSGGTGAFWTGIGSLLPAMRVRTNTRAVSVDPRKRTVQFEDGAVVGYRHLISTLPLDVAAQMVGDEQLVELTRGLRHSSVNVVGLGVDGDVGLRIADKCWMYFPGTDVPFYRVTNFSHHSPAHVPLGVDGASLLVEVSESLHRPVDHELLVSDVVHGLVSTGVLADADQVSHTWLHRAEYAYPTPTLGRDDIVNRALDRLEPFGIHSRGRFGGWRYEVGNMDHSFAQGFESATRILTGEPEITIWNPGLVNTPNATMGRGRPR
jgi:protoporphyrinogen oxidase